jgi:hypothetical protein
MKLRLQYADMLPASTKPGPDDFPGKGAFGTAMEEVMAASGSTLPLRVETPNALLRKQAQIGSYAGTAESERAIDHSSVDTHVAQEALAQKIQAGVQSADLTQPAERSELTSGQSSIQNPDSKVYTPPEQPPPERMREDPTSQVSHIQSPVVRELHAKSHDIALMKSSSSHAIRKAETMRNAPTHPVDGQADGVPPVVSQPIDGVMGVMPMPRLQPAEPGSQSDKSQPLQSSSTALSGRVRVQTAMALSHGDLRGTPLAAPAPLTMTQLSKTAAGPGGKVSESAPADIDPTNLTKPHVSSPSIGKAHTDGAVPPNPAFRPQAAHEAAGVHANAQQTDTRALKDTGKKIETAEVKSDVKTGGAGYLATMPPLVQHPTLPNVAPRVMLSGEKSTAAHPPETSAAQVLQKMDFAGPSGPVQLRMDARRLDVGVSSDALGWVEVRATTVASGRVDATVHVQSDASAQVLSNQSREISEYAREHSVQLGEVSVGVGTGDNAQSQSGSTNTPDGNGTRVRRSEQPLADAERMDYAGEAVSLISVRA